MTMDTWQTLESTIIACRRCPRLVAWREQVAQIRKRAFRDQEYWGRPVPGFGDHRARVLVVGLAPGAHGANRTGRMFTGDGSADFLYAALHRAGFASQPVSASRGDGMVLRDLFISAACRCAPPDNKPIPEELSACLPYLIQEAQLLDGLKVVVALGRIAFDTVLKLHRDGSLKGTAAADASPSYDMRRGVGPGALSFSHGAVYPIGDGGLYLVCSYHPSRQNTQTGRLTAEMFDEVWAQVGKLL
jgi:uracil-DNA glycosylase family 4